MLHVLSGVGLKAAISAVAKILGNTPGICRKCYVHPAVLETYLDGQTIEGLKQKADQVLEDEAIDLRTSEKAFLEFLRSGPTRKLT